MNHTSICVIDLITNLKLFKENSTYLRYADDRNDNMVTAQIMYNVQINSRQTSKTVWTVKSIKLINSLYLSQNTNAIIFNKNKEFLIVALDLLEMILH